MNEKPGRTDRRARRVSRLKRCAKWGAIALALTVALVAWAVYDDVRTLASLRRIEGSNAYVMDYYCDYHMDEIRAAGVDAHNVEGSLIAAYFPAPIEAIANRRVPLLAGPAVSRGEVDDTERPDLDDHSYDLASGRGAAVMVRSRSSK